MRIQFIIVAALFTLSYTNLAWSAQDQTAEHLSEHGGQIFHAFTLEADIGVGQYESIASWDLEGWVGGDINKLHLKSEGEVVDGKQESTEFWALYSRNVATFWDAQIGMRQDTKPAATTYLVAGFEGLAPHFFETEAHVFVSNEGDVSMRLRQENHFLITQRWIVQLYGEANLYAQDVVEQGVGRGLAHAEFGIQTRYEITRKFAPYVDIRYERSFGETASIAKKNGEDNDDVIASIGLRLMF